MTMAGFYRVFGLVVYGYVAVTCAAFLALYRPRVYRGHHTARMLRLLALAIGFPAARSAWRLVIVGPPPFVDWFDVASGLVAPVLMAGAIAYVMVVCRSEIRRRPRR